MKQSKSEIEFNKSMSEFARAMLERGQELGIFTPAVTPAVTPSGSTPEGSPVTPAVTPIQEKR